MYELEEHAILSSSRYLASLNAPSPWSTKMMPHHRNMVRSQCRVLESVGANVARHALTVRFSPAPGREELLRANLKTLAAALADRAGCVGGHLLRHEPPPIESTTEQKIRGGDRYADWVFVAVGYDNAVLRSIAQAELSSRSLADAGAQLGAQGKLYTLAFSATPADVSRAPHAD
jgi:hypothetical protein